MKTDKQLHLAAGYIISITIGLLNPVIGLIFGIVAGIGKEVYDKVSGRGKCEILDAVATVVGSFVGFGVIKLLI